MANFKGYSGGNMENIVAEKFRELDTYNNAVHPEYTKNNYELLGRFKSSEEVSEYVYSEFEKVKGIDYYDQPKNMREGDKAVNCIVNLVVNSWMNGQLRMKTRTSPHVKGILARKDEPKLKSSAGMCLIF